MCNQHSVIDDYKAFNVRERRQYAREFTRPARLQPLNRHPERVCGGLHRNKDGFSKSIVGVQQDRCPIQVRKRLCKNLEALHTKLGAKMRKSRDIPARLRNPRNYTCRHGIAYRRRNDGRVWGCTFSRHSSRRPVRHKDINFQVFELGSEFRKPVIAPFRPPEFDQDIFALKIAKVPQPRTQRFHLANVARRGDGS
jgi:hypothetical protein